MLDRISLDDLALAMNEHFTTINENLAKFDAHVHDMKDTLAAHGHQLEDHHTRLATVEQVVDVHVDRTRRTVAKFEITVSLVELHEEPIVKEPPKPPARRGRGPRW